MGEDNSNQRPEQVGILLVHGIGEQTRFEHLDGEVRKLVTALQAFPAFQPAHGGGVAVEIRRGIEAGFHAEQDTWRVGPASTVCVSATAKDQREQRFHFHEVWWADVNERYSIAKQVRFWLWGLSVWLIPRKERSTLAGADYVFPPKHPGGLGMHLWVRLRLFGAGVVFALLGLSVGIIIFILKRLFDMQTPPVLQTVTNYLSGVKIYNQPYRIGPGLRAGNDDFLDNMNEPPRYSIRRRMIRALADMALAPYDRWYVLAHSLGSLVAFNGLMETAYTWPGYLDEAQWGELKRRHLAGPIAQGAGPIPDRTIPRRPGWCGEEIAYRTRIFRNFRGLMTYGSPLEKFATIWPARVPLALEPAFSADACWVNILDPIDPVSGVLKSFSAVSHACCPHPQNIGYRAGPVLLLSHLEYLSRQGRGHHDLPSATMAWLIGRGAPGSDTNPLSGTYPVGRKIFHIRDIAAWAWWIVGVAGFAIVAALVIPTFLELFAAGAVATSRAVNENTGGEILPRLGEIMNDWLVHPLAAIVDRLSPTRLGHVLAAIVQALSPGRVAGILGLWAADMLLLSIALPLVIGIGMRLFVLRPDEDAEPRGKHDDITHAHYKSAHQKATATASMKLDTGYELPSPEPAPFTDPGR